MKKTKEIAELLKLIYNSTFIPLHFYEKERCICAFPSNDLPVDFISANKSMLDTTEGDCFYISTKESLYVALARDNYDREIIIGPVCSTNLSSKDIDSLLTTYMLPHTYKEEIQTFYEITPLFSLYQFLNILAMVNQCLTGKLIDVFEKFGLVNPQTEKSIGETHSVALVERKENSVFHNTYNFEKKYFDYVEKGDVDGLLQFMQTIPSLSEGQTSSDSLRQAKNIFISSTTLITRHAIAGGLDIETAYQLSDSYIQEVEKMSDLSSITSLNATAAIDFTKRVAEAKIPTGMSQDIFNCIQYVSNHVNQNISVEEIAQYLNMDRTTLSKKFKRELGFNISSYIMRRKLEEAKSLLNYTDMTISEISEYLCFSSQAYFQNVFKKKYGITPKEYRKKQTQA